MYELDFKYSIWLDSVEEWEEYEPGIRAEILAALEAGEDVDVSSAPRKESRDGFFQFSRTDTGAYQVDASFSAHWDEVRYLPEAVDVEVDVDDEEELDRFGALTPAADDGDPGYTASFLLEAEDFEALERAIRIADNDHYEATEAAWQEFVRAAQEEYKPQRRVRTQSLWGDGTGIPLGNVNDWGDGWGNGDTLIESNQWVVDFDRTHMAYSQ